MSTNRDSGDGADPGEDRIDADYWSPCRDSYSTLEELEKRKDSMPPHCVEQYLVDVQIAILEAALKKYKDLMSHGYDDKFKVYQRYAKAQVPAQIDAFMASERVDKYFTCKETRNVTCRSSCTFITCQEDCVRAEDCRGGRATLDIKCPQMLHEVDMLDSSHIPNATFSLHDPEGFWRDLGHEYGVEESWVTFGRRHMRISNGCQFAGDAINKCIDEQDNWWYNYPNADQDKIKIYNPRDVIGKSYDKTAELLSRFKTVRDWNDYDDLMPWSDVVDATALPSLATEAAVNSMDKIIDKAQEIEKKEREEMILSFVTAFLFFIPVAGEAAGAAGLTAARGLLRGIGTVGDAGLMVYGVVANPESALISVFAFLAGAGVGRDGFSKAANARRSMKASELDALGPMKGGLDRLGAIRGRVCHV